MKKKLITAGVFASNAIAGTALAQVQAPSISMKTGGSVNDLIGIITEVANWVLLAAGALAVLFLIIGGIQYIISSGNESRAKAAKNTIMYALIGVAIIVLALFLINVVMDLLA